MRAQNFIIGFIVTFIVIAGFSTLINDINLNYDKSMDTSNYAIINNVNTSLSGIYNQTVSMGDEFETGTEFGQEGVSLLELGDKAWNSLKLMFNSLVYIPSAMSYAAGMLGLPDWIVYAITSIVVLTLIIGLVVLITGAIRGLQN